MRTIKLLDELILPKKHKRFLEIFLKNVPSISNRDKIERLVLFGSCARGEATDTSDVDIVALGENIDDDTLGELYFCAPTPMSGFYVKNDILTITNDVFNQYKDSYGMVQKYIEKEGIDLCGLL